jgi:hypothetical protein
MKWSSDHESSLFTNFANTDINFFFKIKKRILFNISYNNKHLINKTKEKNFK